MPLSRFQFFTEAYPTVDSGEESRDQPVPPVTPKQILFPLCFQIEVKCAEGGDNGEGAGW
jgi:hypothetical protein